MAGPVPPAPATASPPPDAPEPATLSLRRPLAIVAAAYLLGIATHDLLPPAETLWLSLASIAVLASCLLAREPVRDTLLLVAVTLAGVGSAQAARYRYPSDHVCLFATDTPRLAQLEIVLDRPPRTVVLPLATGRPLPPKQAALARVTRVQTLSGWTSARGDVLVQIAEPHPRLAAGQTVRVLGRLERPGPAMNPGQFDWSAYYRDQRVLVSLQVPHADNLLIVASGSPSRLERSRSAVRRWLAEGFDPADSLEHALLRALLLGDHDPELRDVQEQFRRTGTSHHLAISGMHVAVLGGVVFAICRLVRMRPAAAWVVAAAFVLVYGLLALPSPPVVRSVLLWGAIGLAVLGARSVDLVHLLAVVVLAMLVLHPLDLLSPGFQLSFGTVLGLITLSRPMLRVIAPTPDPDRELARRLQRPGFWSEFGRRVDLHAMGVLAAALVAWLVSLPLVARHFGQLNTWAVVGSIVLAPLVFAALVAGMAKIVLTACFPFLASPLADAAAAVVGAMRGTVEQLGRLPFADVPLPPPPIPLVVAGYVAIVLALCPWTRPSLRWLSRGAVASVLFAMFVLPFTTGAAWRNDPAWVGDCRVTLLAVGAGSCAVIEPPGGRVFVVDAGSASLGYPVRRAIAPFLRRRGITAIDTVVLTHANYDHFSAAGELVESYGVREVLTPPRFVEHAGRTPPGTALLRSLASLDRPPRSLSAGQSIPLSARTTLEVLHPASLTTLDPNDDSLVLRLTHAGTRVLLTGDLEERGLQSLLSREPGTLRSAILVAPHHGAADPSTPALLAAVSPSLILASNDRSLTGSQHAFDALAGDIPLRRTHDRGALTIEIARDGAWRFEAFRDPAAGR